MSGSQRAEERQFEVEVIRVARWLYPNTDGQGSIIFQGRERDGVFVNDDSAVAIECTVSKGKGKAESDAKKLDEICRYLVQQYPERDVRGYFITRDEPTADQRGEVNAIGNPLLTTISFDTFRSRLLKVASYLDARLECPFGSARNPTDGSTRELGMYTQMQFTSVAGEATRVRYKDLLSNLSDGKHIILLGEYGAGKSMTLRQIFLDLAQEYSARGSTLFPIHLSLREHHGQTEPAEALGRHARSIGFPNPSHLVRAWRAGYARILLDGFDEIAPPNLGSGRSENERAARRDSVELVRRFLRETPTNAGALVAGRRNFFHNNSDLRRALDLSADAVIVNTADFTEEQVTRYLEDQGWTASIPYWLPSKPLLLGYLASMSILGEIVSGDSIDAAEGWDLLLKKVFDRDAQIEGGVDGQSLREIFERLATKARSTGSGLGPIFFEDARAAFRDILGYAPDVRHEVALRRLPMLAPDDPSTESRKIIDDSLADVARAGDVVRYINDPYTTNLESHEWFQLLEQTGVASAAHQIRRSGGNAGLVITALAQLVRGEPIAPPLAADILAVAIEFESTVPEKIYLRELVIPELKLPADMDLSGVEFQDCLFEYVEIRTTPAKMPYFHACAFIQIDGARGEYDLPSDKFNNCEFDAFDSAQSTNDALLELPVSIPVRVGLVIMKKLFAQQGTGRKDGALRRGMPPGYIRYVNDVIGVLIGAGVVVRAKRGQNTIWMPVRTQRTRIQRLLDNARNQTWDDDEDLIQRLENID